MRQGTGEKAKEGEGKVGLKGNENKMKSLDRVENENFYDWRKMRKRQ